jgi:hypothetical protein
MRRYRILAFFPLLLNASCDPTAEEIWSRLVKKCADSDLLGEVLYFGPSNTTGPGTVWRKTSQGGYNLRWRTGDLVATEDFTEEGNPYQCSGSSSSTSNINPALVLETVLAPITGSLGANLKRATSVVAAVDGMMWIDLAEGAYLCTIRDPNNERIHQDLEQGNKYVMTRGLLVQGLVASLEYERATVVDTGLKTKLSGEIVTDSSEGLGIKLSAEWRGDTKLELKADSRFFIAGELSPWKVGGLAAESPKIGTPAIVPKEARVAREHPE